MSPVLTTTTAQLQSLNGNEDLRSDLPRLQSRMEEVGWSLLWSCLFLLMITSESYTFVSV